MQLGLGRRPRPRGPVRHPLAKRTWWPSTCSPSSGPAGDDDRQVARAARACMIVPGPPWHTTTAAAAMVASMVAASQVGAATRADVSAVSRPACTSTRRAVGWRAATPPATATTGRTGGGRCRRWRRPAAARAVGSQQRTEDDAALVERCCSGHCTTNSELSGPAHPPGQGAGVDPVVDLDVHAGDAQQPGQHEDRHGDAGAVGDDDGRAVRVAAPSRRRRGCAAGCAMLRVVGWWAHTTCSPSSSDVACGLRNVIHVRSCCDHHGRSRCSWVRCPPSEHTSRTWWRVARHVALHAGTGRARRAAPRSRGAPGRRTRP